MLHGAFRYSLLTLLGATFALAATGCLKINLTIHLNEDGSGQVIEKMTYGEKLVNIARQVKKLPQLEELAGEKAARQRVAEMGKGVRFLSNKTTTQPDGSTTVTNIYDFDDINGLRVAPLVLGKTWNRSCLTFQLTTSNNLRQEYVLRMPMQRPPATQGDDPKNLPPLLTGLNAQQVRTLMPVFNDLIEGFELSLSLEVYDYSQWASATRGHPTATWNPSQATNLAIRGGRMTIYRITDKQLQGNEDALLMILPWLQTGREAELDKVLSYTRIGHWSIDGFMYSWRAIQGPRGREFY